MSDERDFGTEARSNRDRPAQTQLDILKVLEQCGIHLDSWNHYIRQQEDALKKEPT
ncbi:hypothetical protein [Paenibacillus azoreducens]|jgi:hypothetical protein|uniref:Uncharacterized protein n=1 Tax=Paenibacillus azoreducens TaxID=116718 RepID=A0A920CS98_9BACL|nr:hypothetical protein [Paenibacillus azoreducens]GIO47218.1 hypothetical protein J34TS1_19830 [Paenibacillus azoreducens]